MSLFSQAEQEKSSTLVTVKNEFWSTLQNKIKWDANIRSTLTHKHSIFRNIHNCVCVLLL